VEQLLIVENLTL